LLATSLNETKINMLHYK